MIAPGAKIDTSLIFKVFRDGAVAEIPLRDLLTRRTIVSVYMRNNTPGCDRQNDSLVAHAAEFALASFNLVAVSRDTGGSHGRYAAKKKISYPLVSDPDDKFAQATDSVVDKSMYGRAFRGPARAAYVLARDGTVLAVIPKVNPAEHAAQVREVIAKLK